MTMAHSVEYFYDNSRWSAMAYDDGMTMMLHFWVLILLVFVLPFGSAIPTPTPTTHVIWHAPFLTGGGYSSEAWDFALGIDAVVANEPAIRFGAVQFAEQQSRAFVDGTDSGRLEFIRNAFSAGKLAVTRYFRGSSRDGIIAVCHATPDVYVPSVFPGWDQIAPCPPQHTRKNAGAFAYSIARTMFETDRIPEKWVPRLNKMDEIWVPTAFHVASFAYSGVVREKLFVVPEAVDSIMFTPAGDRYALPPPTAPHCSDEFTFLSVFKWERRKGWDVLLKAFFNEFLHDECVRLVIKTKPFYTDFEGETIQEYAKRYAFDNIAGLNKELPALHVIETPIDDMPSLFRAADAFVLPSRGEGWGRPVAEAMATSLPVLATNWSGPAAFINEENAYPVRVDRTTLVSGHEEEGHKWAEPSQEHLQELMRHVFENANQARAKGARGRRDMIEKYSPEKVASIVIERVKDILRNYNHDGEQSKQEL